jgi:hypothetical protein
MMGNRTGLYEESKADDLFYVKANYLSQTLETVNFDSESTELVIVLCPLCSSKQQIRSLKDLEVHLANNCPEMKVTCKMC